MAAEGAAKDPIRKGIKFAVSGTTLTLFNNGYGARSSEAVPMNGSTFEQDTAMKVNRVGGTTPHSSACAVAVG